jgi:hypothetical protein
LRTGVEDGRRTFANTLKYISITTSANFGNMVSMALATPLLPFLPLAAKQILLNNFLSDVPSIAISSDNVDPDRVSRPQRWSIKEIRRFMIVFGLISSVFDLLTFAVLLLVFHAGEATFQTSWFLISLLTELADRFGQQCVTLSVDAAAWNVVVRAGSETTSRSAVEWAIEGEQRGAGEILLTSVDRDGTQTGYDTALIAAVRRCVRVPVVASGGARSGDDFVAAVQAGADAVLAASIFHDGVTTVRDVKSVLDRAGIAVRP